jgi:hypothetical protein
MSCTLLAYPGAESTKHEPRRGKRQGSKGRPQSIGQGRYLTKSDRPQVFCFRIFGGALPGACVASKRGLMWNTKRIIAGQRFGRLVAVERIENDKHSNQCWRFACDCGRDVNVPITMVAQRRTQSCGCLRRELLNKFNYKHGMAGTPLYQAWCNMIHRCTNPGNAFFKQYGGRGISVCKRWRDSFEAFLADMGPKPTPKHTIDRIDPNGNYEPGNCRWATRSEQRRNQREKSAFDSAV